MYPPPPIFICTDSKWIAFIARVLFVTKYKQYEVDSYNVFMYIAPPPMTAICDCNFWNLLSRDCNFQNSAVIIRNVTVKCENCSHNLEFASL